MLWSVYLLGTLLNFNELTSVSGKKTVPYHFKEMKNIMAPSATLKLIIFYKQRFLITNSILLLTSMNMKYRKCFKSTFMKVARKQPLKYNKKHTILMP